MVKVPCSTQGTGAKSKPMKNPKPTFKAIDLFCDEAVIIFDKVTGDILSYEGQKVEQEPEPEPEVSENKNQLTLEL
jgi:hypothetical protein